jgi:hypothetical protein
MFLMGKLFCTCKNANFYGRKIYIELVKAAGHVIFYEFYDVNNACAEDMIHVRGFEFFS